MKRVIALAAWGTVLGAMSVSAAVPASAAGPVIGPGGSTTFGPFPAGVACDFAVSIDLLSGGEGKSLTFTDSGSSVSRLVLFARPSTWEITNLETGDSATVTIPATQWQIVSSPDGTTTIKFSGGVIGFNGPADTPPGPFSLTHAGRVVFVVAPDGTGTIETIRGHTTLLCPLVAA